MRYSNARKQKVASPLTGRGTGVRHAGGGSMGGGKGTKGPITTGGFARKAETGGFSIGGRAPPPGSLAADAAMAPAMSSTPKPGKK